MADTLAAPDQLQIWVPGQLTVHSPETGWDGVSVRGYRSGGSDVELPPLRDYVVVAYRRGRTSMRRRIDGAWVCAELGPGDVSLLTRAAASHWVWPGDIEVVHIYLGQETLADTCREMYERDVAEVALHDEIKADDPAIHRTAMLIAQEAAQGAAGSRMMIDALSCQLSVLILRRHADVRFAECGVTARLTCAQERAVRDYVDAHLREAISLDALAGVTGLSRYHFARRFRRSTGTTPHQFVLQRRVDRARALLERTDTPLHDIACLCGFADQSHMTREFRKRVGASPGRYRARGR